MSAHPLIQRTVVILFAAIASSSAAHAAIECHQFPPQKPNEPRACYEPYRLTVEEGFFHYQEGGSRCWKELGEEESRARIVHETKEEVIFELDSSEGLETFTFYPEEEKGVIDFIRGYRVELSCSEH